MKTRHWDRLGNGGLTFTELGMGTAPLGNLYRAISDDDAHATLQAAWDGGVRYYDTAPLYGLGLAETRLNRFLRDKPRDDYVLSTKVGRILHPCAPEMRDGQDKWFEVPARNEQFDFTYDGVMRSLEFSFERLGQYRSDILFCHDLDNFNMGSQERVDFHLAELMDEASGGYKALVKMRDEGVIKAFGAGVNEWQTCQWLTERGDFDMFLLAGRYTLLEQTALESFLPLCEARGIGIVLGGPYNSGILATGPVEGAFYNYDPASAEILDRVCKIEALCESHGVRLMDAAFQFPLRHPQVVSVIPGGQGPGETATNIAAEQAEVPPALWQALKAEGVMREDAPTG
ncbi:MAG: aldo/keto reductase [Pseudomonadota bacterium]